MGRNAERFVQPIEYNLIRERQVVNLAVRIRTIVRRKEADLLRALEHLMEASCLILHFIVLTRAI